MKILHVINSLEVGGAEKLLADTIPMLNLRGLVAEVLVLNNKPTFLDDILIQSDVKVHKLNSRSLYSPLNIFKIVPFLRSFNIVHVHLFPSLYWVALAKLISFSSTKLIFTEHSTSNRRWQNKLFKTPDQIIYRCYSAIVCITEQVKDAIKKNVEGLTNKVVVIENGIDLFRYQDAKGYLKYEIAQDTSVNLKYIIQVSAFRIEKDQDTLIRAISLLPSEIKLLLVGEGERRETCEQLVDDLNLRNRVVFLGKRADIPRLFKTADLSVLSSHWEGFGLVAIESMASGLPVIASNVAGLASVVGEPRLLFDKGDYAQLANKILHLLENKSLYNELVKFCIDRAAKYDINKMVEAQIKLYKRILDN